MTKEELLSQLRAALAAFPAREIAQALAAERQRRQMDGEESLRSGATLPRLGATQWAALKEYLIADGGEPLDPQHALAMAYDAIQADDQDRFWSALLASARGVWRNHPRVRMDALARRMRSVEGTGR